MKEALITVKNLRKAYQKREGRRGMEALHDIDLTVYQNEFLVLLGPSGCGKSTLLRILAGLEGKSGGTVSYGSAFDPARVSFVFQNFGILPWLTVEKNIELNLIGAGVPEHRRTKDVHDILERFGLAHFRNHVPLELSGGMRQRVGLARAFVSRPSVILLDEPFSELDFFTATDLRKLLLEMWQSNSTTVVMVSHYIEEAAALADRVMIFSDRPGTIHAEVRNTLPRPRDARSKQFFDLEDEIAKYFVHKDIPLHQ